MCLPDLRARVLDLTARDVRATGAVVWVDARSLKPMEDRVTELAAARPDALQDHRDWLEDVERLGDEACRSRPYPSRAIALENVDALAQCERQVAQYGRGGMSAARRLRKFEARGAADHRGPLPYRLEQP